MTAATKIDSATVIKRAFEQPQWYLTKTAYNIKVRIETIKEFVNGQSPKNILDIGCGDGSLSLHLLTTDNHITLLDRSKRMMEIACSMSRPPDTSARPPLLLTPTGKAHPVPTMLTLSDITSTILPGLVLDGADRGPGPHHGRSPIVDGGRLWGNL